MISVSFTLFEMAFALPVIFAILQFSFSSAEAEPLCEVTSNDNFRDNFAVHAIDMSTSDEVRTCVLSKLSRDGDAVVVVINSSDIQELKAGIFKDIRVLRLVLQTPNLVRVENGILDPTMEGLWRVEIVSDNLEELNEMQFKDFDNLQELTIVGTKLKYISFDFLSEYSNLRKVEIINATDLVSIGPISAADFGFFLLENTGVEKLPPRMFENRLGSLRAIFKNNKKLKMIGKSSFQHDWESTRKLYFYDTPIDVVEPDFITTDTISMQLLLEGNKLGKVDKAVFEPLLRKWKESNVPVGGSESGLERSSGSWIKWDADGGRKSAPIDCNCSLSWLASDPELKKYLKNAVCKTGKRFEEFNPKNLKC